MTQAAPEEPEFDVVLDALEHRRDRLFKMVKQNSEAGLFNVMDQIRLEQIDQLERAIMERKNALQK